MREQTIASLFLLSLFFNNVFAVSKTQCFDDRGDHKLLINEIEDSCGIVEQMQDFNTHEDPASEATLDGVSYPLYDRDNPSQYKEEFKLSVDPTKNHCLLNVTISKCQLERLRIRVTNLAKSNIYWRAVEFNSSHKSQELSLIFKIPNMNKLKIEFYAEGANDYKFFRRFHFVAPSKFDLDVPFIYVDTTYSEKVHLYVQPCLEERNITNYEVVFGYATNDSVINKFNLTGEVLDHEQQEFLEDSRYRFVVTSMGAKGKSPTDHLAVLDFEMRTTTQKLIIMMVGIVVLPIVICFVLYLIYAYYRHRDKQRMKDPSCLLVYSAMHDAHISAMVKLAEYLRTCGINLMIDVLDIPQEIHKNPSHWCSRAFQRANTIIVAMSPSLNHDVVVTKTIYRDLDGYANKLIHENRRWSTKKYITLKLPYCKEGTLPGELSSVRPLEIPKQLKKLINKIHRMKYTDLHDVPDPKDLIECMRLAEEIILYGDCDKKSDCLEKLTEIILPRKNKKFIDIEKKDSSDEDTSAVFLPRSSTNNKQQHGNNEPMYDKNIHDLDL